MNFKKLFTGVAILLLLFFARQQCLAASVSAQEVESQAISATQDDSKPIESIILKSVEQQGQINLSRGSKNNDINRVVTVQSKLGMINDQNGNPYFDYKKLEPDQPYGIFGSATEVAVANFQKWFNKYPGSQGAKSLRTDGVVDDATWAALGLKSQDFILARGSADTNVTQLQKEMERRKLLSMPTDSTGNKLYGYYGMSTQDAVNKYKSDKDINLQNDGPYMGKVGSTTWDSLFKLLNGEVYLRQAVESRGGKVDWNSNTQAITAKLNNREKQYDFVRCKFVNSSVVVKEQDLLSYFYQDTPKTGFHAVGEYIYNADEERMILIGAGIENPYCPAPASLLRSGNISSYRMMPQSEFDDMMAGLIDPDYEGITINPVSVFQTMLDIGGMVPVIGEACDGINAGIYLLKGDKVNALLSAGALIPIAGDGVTALKWGSKGAKYLDEAIEATEYTVKSSDELKKLKKIEVLKANRIAGRTAEILAKDELEKQGYEIVASQVSVRTSQGLRRIDYLVRDVYGKLLAIEVKSGNNSRTMLQILKDKALLSEGGKFIGKNAPGWLKDMGKVNVDTEVKQIILK